MKVNTPILLIFVSTHFQKSLAVLKFMNEVTHYATQYCSFKETLLNPEIFNVTIAHIRCSPIADVCIGPLEWIEESLQQVVSLVLYSSAHQGSSCRTIRSFSMHPLHKNARIMRRARSTPVVPKRRPPAAPTGCMHLPVNLGEKTRQSREFPKICNDVQVNKANTGSKKNRVCLIWSSHPVCNTHSSLKSRAFFI